MFAKKLISHQSNFAMIIGPNVKKDYIEDYFSLTDSKILRSIDQRQNLMEWELADNWFNLFPFSNLEKSEQFERVEAIKPGFINFFVSENLKFLVVEKILKEKELYGKNSIGKNSKVLVEFVSANPTGPLHVGHGRGAVFGDCLSKLLEENGYEVVKEYYVNDAGKQIEILVTSVIQR